MKPRLLIVDDEKKIIDRFTGYLQGEDIEIATARSLDQAVLIAESFKPAAATIDFSIGGNEGDEVAEALRTICPDIRMAGITGGDPEVFSPTLFEIRASKNIKAEEYIGIVRQLLVFPSEQTLNRPLSDIERENLVAVNILLQGYNIARKLQLGEPIEGIENARVTLKTPSEEETRNLLDFKKVGIDAKQVYDLIIILDPTARDSIVAGRLFAKIVEGRMNDVLDEEAEEAEGIIRKILEGL